MNSIRPVQYKDQDERSRKRSTIFYVSVLFILGTTSVEFIYFYIFQDPIEVTQTADLSTLDSLNAKIDRIL